MTQYSGLMDQAIYFAQKFSKDPSTQVGCLIVDKEDHTVVTEGYNGMPRGFDDKDPIKNARPLKYDFYEHAERNALYNKARDYLQNSVVVVTHVPSTGCIRALVSVGAKTLYVPYSESLEEVANPARQLLDEGGVRVFFVLNGAVVGAGLAHAKHHKKYIDNLDYLKVCVQKSARDPNAEGCLFLDPQDLRVLSHGYSDIPRGIEATDDRWNGSDRQFWVEGAVRSAIFNKIRRDLKECIALVTATPCIDCARALAFVGVKTVVHVPPSADLISRWKISFEKTSELFTEAQIASIELDPSSNS